MKSEMEERKIARDLLRPDMKSKIEKEKEGIWITKA